MTKKEAIRQTEQENTLLALGFTRDEAEQLRRISMTLHRWAEKECGDGNGCIERDDETNKTYWLNAMTGRRYPIRDLETGAIRRLKAIIEARNKRFPPYAGGPENQYNDQRVHSYVQGDPRGAALYILRPGDVPNGKSMESYYTHGVCVY